MEKAQMDKEKIRNHIYKLKIFYTNLTVYAVVSSICVIIWLCMGAGPFWPIWVIFGYSLSAIMQAIKLKQIPAIACYLPFLKAGWEEEQYKKLTKNHFKEKPEENFFEEIEQELVQEIHKTKPKK